MSWNTNTDAVLSAIRVATNENVDEQEVGVEGSGAEDGAIGVGGEMDDEFNNSIASGICDVKSAFDVAVDESSKSFFLDTSFHICYLKFLYYFMEVCALVYH